MFNNSISDNYPSFKEVPHFEIDLDASLYSESLFRINPSIVKFNNTYWCAYRSNNMDRNHRNYIAQLNDDFSSKKYDLLIAENGNNAFEDVRLFVFKNTLMAIYTYLPFENNAWIDKYTIGLGVVDTATGTIIKQQELTDYSTRYHEKNWMPLVSNDILYLVTDFDPGLRVLINHGEIGSLLFKEAYLAGEKTRGWDYGELRGGTPFIENPFEQTQWKYSFVHSSVWLPNGPNFSRFYTYTVLRLDLSDFKFEFYNIPIGYSKYEDDPSYHAKWDSTSRGELFRVVFPMGILPYQKGVLISVGKDDCAANLFYYSWDFISELFSKPEKVQRNGGFVNKPS